MSVLGSPCPSVFAPLSSDTWNLVRPRESASGKRSVLSSCWAGWGGPGAREQVRENVAHCVTAMGDVSVATAVYAIALAREYLMTDEVRLAFTLRASLTFTLSRTLPAPSHPLRDPN